MIASTRSRSVVLSGSLGGAARARGFTLIELIITIVVVAILSLLAFPSMRTTILRNRVRDTANDIYLSLIQTRSEALKLNTNVSLQPASGGWGNGWNIPDPNNPGSYLFQHGPVNTVTVAMAGAANVTYRSTGRIAANANPVFTVSGSSGSYTASASVNVDPSGRPYVTETLW